MKVFKGDQGNLGLGLRLGCFRNTFQSVSGKALRKSLLGFRFQADGLVAVVCWVSVHLGRGGFVVLGMPKVLKFSSCSCNIRRIAAAAAIASVMAVAVAAMAAAVPVTAAGTVEVPGAAKAAASAAATLRFIA